MGRNSDADQRLRNSARELIHERGYNAVGIGEICSRAGVNKGSFYYFYPSKQKLVLDVIDAAWHDAREMLEESLLGEAPPLDRLRAYLQRIYLYHRDAGESFCGCPLGNLAAEMSTLDPLMRSRLQQTFDGHIGYYERLIEEAKERGELSAAVNSRQAADNLFALIQGKILLAKTRNHPAVLADLPDLAGLLLES